MFKSVTNYQKEDLEKRNAAIPLMDMSGTDEEFSKKREAIMNDPEHIRFGGSDVASILGISPFKTKKALYHNRINFIPKKKVSISEDLAAFGHAMEDGIAKLFPYFMEKNCGIEASSIAIENDTWMYQHPDYEFAVADLDRRVYINGIPGILEIKTNNPNNYKARELWEKGIAPAYYEYQVRWYMMVTNLDYAYIFVMYGSGIDQMQAVLIKRDLEIEKMMLNAAIDFYNCCVSKTEPNDDELHSELFNKYWVQTYGEDLVAGKDYNPIELPNNHHFNSLVMKAKKIETRIDELKDLMKEAENEQAEIIKEFLILAEGKPANFTMKLSEDTVLRWNVSPSMRKPVFEEERFKAEHPNEYNEFLKSSMDVTRAKKKYSFVNSYFLPAEVNETKPPKISEFKAVTLKKAL